MGLIVFGLMFGVFVVGGIVKVGVVVFGVVIGGVGGVVVVVISGGGGGMFGFMVKGVFEGVKKYGSVGWSCFVMGFG